MSERYKRIGKCEVCNDNDAKYTCPKCEVRTCGLQCVNIHKQEFQCDGIRNKVAFKPISKFSNLDLLSDYRLLEEVTRSVDAYVRDPLKKYTRQLRDLPVHLFRLRAAAMKRGTRLMFLPANFSRHKENSTYLNWKTQVLSWRIEWIFPHADVKHVDKRIEESSRLEFLLDRLLKPDQCPRLLKEPLKYYHSVGHNGVSLLLKAENTRKANSKFHLLDTSMTLRKALRGKSLIEFPTIYVILDNHRDAFEIVDSDEEMEEESLLEEKSRFASSHSSSSSNQKHRRGKRKVKSLLFHNSDFSSEGSDDDNGGNRRNKFRFNSNKKSEASSISAGNHDSQLTMKKSKSDLNVSYDEVQSEGKLPSAAKLLSGCGQLNIPSYDVLIKLPH